VARTLGIVNPLDPANSIIEPRSLDPNVPWFFFKDDLPPNPLGNGWGPSPPLNKKEPSLPEIPEMPSLPKTLWPGGPNEQDANDVVRQDFSALQNFGRYQPSYLPSSNAAGLVAPFVPAGPLPGGPLITPGATRGAGDVGSAVTSPIPFIRSAPQSAPGGLPGLLIEAGLNDPLNPDAPPPGGLVGLIQEYLRSNARGNN